jgi:hypothetical protein
MVQPIGRSPELELREILDLPYALRTQKSELAEVLCYYDVSEISPNGTKIEKANLLANIAMRTTRSIVKTLFTPEKLNQTSPRVISDKWVKYSIFYYIWGGIR